MTKGNQHILSDVLQRSASLHSRLCPRQVLGVRMGLLAVGLHGFDPFKFSKRLITHSETDGCFVDGIGAATGCTVGHRTLRIYDYGKVAAVFTDFSSGKSFRIVPGKNVRSLAGEYAQEGVSDWEKQLNGYQHIPDSDLFNVQSVILKTPIEQIISIPGVRVTCRHCGEEILNERNVTVGKADFCVSCAGDGYYIAA